MFIVPYTFSLLEAFAGKADAVIAAMQAAALIKDVIFFIGSLLMQAVQQAL